MSAVSRTASSSARTEPRRHARLALLALAGVALAGPASAHRALLIGVGDYPRLADRALALAAPAEDARRLGAALNRAGLPAAAITLMTDREGQAPTRDGVLSALRDMARDVAADEQVLVYFSGHGTQAPARDPSRESDGMDELYLMADAAGWDGSQGRVPGAIDDRELADALDAIRARGADVWFVADTCHAAGVFRGAGGRAKAIAPAALRIPSRSPRAVAPPRRDPPAGRLAAFYAAGPGGLAAERRLPLGSPDARTLSQFSYALVRALDAGRLRSLRDLAIAVNAADEALGGDAPQPLFEGALDMNVLGLSAGRTRRWTVERRDGTLVIPAGLEEGLTEGAALRLRDAGGAVAGTAVVTRVSYGSATLTATGAPAGLIEAEPVSPPLDGRARLLAALPAIAGTGAAAALKVEARLWRPGARRACPPLDPAGTPTDETRPFDLLAPVPLGQCDVVLATLSNLGDAAVDASPFYLDAAGRMLALAYLGGEAVRIAPGESRRVAVRLLSEDRQGQPLATGSERLILLALPAQGEIGVDLRGIADAVATRGATADSSGAGALVYRWTVATKAPAL